MRPVFEEIGFSRFLKYIVICFTGPFCVVVEIELNYVDKYIMCVYTLYTLETYT